LQKPNATLCFSCEKNVLQIFNAIITQTHSYHQLNFNDVQLFNANDFYNLPDKFLHIANCKKIDKHFVEPLNLNSSNITYLTHKNYRNYDALIKNRGGIDLLVLEINNNGKIAFNEPNTPHYIKTHIAKLSQTTRFEYKPSFANDLDEVPHKAITIGLRTILKAKKIILVGIGKDSDVSISKLFEDKYNPI
jgi:glucosamine-6-phosphate deaminase